MKPHIQTTPFTTAAAALLTIMHNINPEIELTRENEFAIWQRTVNLPTRGSNIFALAHHAHKNGLSPHVIVEKVEYQFPDYRFYRYTKDDVENAAFCAQRHFVAAREAGITIEQKEISLKDVQVHLKNGATLLLRLNVKPFRKTKRNTSNYVIVHKYENNTYSLIDPALGGLSVPCEVFEEAFESLQTKKYRDHRMIVFKK